MTDPVGPTEGTQRNTRGGYFNEPGYCRATLRYGIQASEFGTAGFRAARNNGSLVADRLIIRVKDLPMSAHSVEIFA